MRRPLSSLAPLLLLLLLACPSGRDDDTTSTNPTTDAQTAPSSVSAEDGPEPVTCEALGGTCSCAGACDMGYVLSNEGTCPQPPDESGACSQDCCVPVSGTTEATAGSTAGSTAADATAGTAETAAPVCDCAALPLCATAPDEDCNGQYPEGHCCDDMAAAMTCSCLEPCDGGFPCCTLQPGCE